MVVYARFATLKIQCNFWSTTYLILLIEHGLSQISPTLKLHETRPPEKQPKLTDPRLIKYLSAWANKMRNLRDAELTPPLVISRTFLRFTRNLELIRNRHLSQSLGEILQLWIVVLLNSLLIEEVIFKKGISSANLQLDHLTVTDDIHLFENNLKNHMPKDVSEENDNTISYTLAMLCCPLLLIFLFENFDLNLFERIDVYTNIADREDKNNEEYKKFLKNLNKKLFYSLAI